MRTGVTRIAARPWGAAVFLLLSGACNPAAPKAAGDLTVFAAASLTESLTALEQAWEQQSETPVTVSFGATSQLAKQVQEGAPADVFASADAEWMDTLQAAGLVRTDTRRDLLGNRLVVVVPKAAAFTPRSLADLGRAELRRLALAGENVPAGRYADAVLAAAGQTSAVQPKITRGDSVRTVLRWVADGESDAGFVYASDAKASPAVVVAFEVPAELQPKIVYPFAVLSTTDTPQVAAEFIAFCASPKGRAVFEEAGFAVLTP